MTLPDLNELDVSKVEIDLLQTQRRLKEVFNQDLCNPTNISGVPLYENQEIYGNATSQSIFVVCDGNPEKQQELIRKLQKQSEHPFYDSAAAQALREHRPLTDISDAYLPDVYPIAEHPKPDEPAERYENAAEMVRFLGQDRSPLTLDDMQHSGVLIKKEQQVRAGSETGIVTNENLMEKMQQAQENNRQITLVPIDKETLRYTFFPIDPLSFDQQAQIIKKYSQTPWSDRIKSAEAMKKGSLSKEEIFLLDLLNRDIQRYAEHISPSPDKYNSNPLAIYSLLLHPLKDCDYAHLPNYLITLRAIKTTSQTPQFIMPIVGDAKKTLRHLAPQIVHPQKDKPETFVFITSSQPEDLASVAFTCPLPDGTSSGINYMLAYINEHKQSVLSLLRHSPGGDIRIDTAFINKPSPKITQYLFDDKLYEAHLRECYH